MKNSLIIFGTRPELIKLIPILLEIRKRGWEKHFKIIFTQQHKDLIHDLLERFNITPDHSLAISAHEKIGLTLSDIRRELQLYITERPGETGFILAQGDTTSCFAAAMTASANQIPFAHVEAGLRTYDLNHPFPEEYFRQVISQHAAVNFTPTKSATDNLLSENVSTDKILQTGNTIVDMVEIWKNGTENEPSIAVQPFLKSNNVLITCHRRENQNSNFDCLIDSVIHLANTHVDLNFLWLCHPNPFVEEKLKHEKLNNTSNIYVLEPVHLFDMFALYRTSKVIITDSGGIQEEAISFNVPTLVIRKKTERQEALDSGNAKIVSVTDGTIQSEFINSLNHPIENNTNPFGDGNAAIRIMDYFGNQLKISYQAPNLIQEENQ
jgi:UDP-N-acetylglucosamine 2-epimerase (non-hydrolysing)